ncbi:MAG TPA: IS21 family transposase [Bacillota bacterium]|nr:IS21 family transposase [Bacillota bacterium]
MIGVELFVEIKYLDRQGLNKTQIADRLGIDRKTVRKYVNQNVKSFEQESGIQRSIVNPYKPYPQYRLNKFPGLTAARLCREISTLSCAGNDHNGLLPPVPYEGSERTIARYIQSIRPHDERTYRPVETLPGEQAQADWGHFGYINMDGKRKHLYAFSFVLSYSRVRYVQFTTRQDTLTLLCCLQNAFEYIGGVPQIILFDNAKTVVSERVGSVIQFNRDLMRFALQYGFKPDACWIYDPESKGKVENSIKYVNRDFFYARPVTDLETLNNECLGWCDEVANKKIHGKTGEVPADRLGEEKQALLPVPSNCQCIP